MNRALGTIGIFVLLAVAYAQGKQLHLPVLSDIRLYRFWPAVPDVSHDASTLRIVQVGDSILIQTSGPRLGPVEKEALIPVAEFRAFWDSLNGLGFWQLKDAYEPSRGTEAYDTAGYISVSMDQFGGSRASKIVWFSAAFWAAPELWQLYDLLCSMERFARPVPDSLKDTVSPHR